ncbi:MAG TPA: 5-deoxy-glucuronate isomerase [Ktedonobacterales bacterium]|nr:5-deoxy-glucuronate isomerase [Ktedonobacterales bacterium]
MASPYLIKGKGFQPGYVRIAAPEQTALRWITIGRLGLVQQTFHEHTTGAQELVITILSGAVSLTVEGGPACVTSQRADVFSGGPTYLCLPPETSYRLTPLTSMADLLLIETPADPGLGVHVVTPEDAPARIVGAGNWARSVWPGTASLPVSRRLLVGETVNPPGNWSSYPPHKHDVDDPPREALYEEVYFFAIKPAGGFGIQRLYERRQGEDALDETFAVEDGDTVIIPRGYHPVVAAPGYQLGYVWSLCGHGRSYGAWSDDPAHAWLRAVEPILASR